MAKTLHRTLAAALLCGAVALTGPALAATHTKAGMHAHQVRHAVLHRSTLSEVDRMERQVTTELNRTALAKATHDETAMVTIPNTVASTETDDDSE
jgi:hypothetical protein